MQMHCALGTIVSQLCGFLLQFWTWISCVFAWFACFQLLGLSNKPTKAQIKYFRFCECCEILPPNGDNFLSNFFPSVLCSSSGRQAKCKCIEWMGVWRIMRSWPWLSTALSLQLQPFSLNILNPGPSPLPFTTASLVIYGNTMRNARWKFNLYWKLSKRRSRSINPPIEVISPSPWFVSSENPSTKTF